MNFFGKLKKSWWIILSFIIFFFFNGLGFIFLGAKTHNINWVIEGIIYEIPWVIALINVPNESALFVMVAIGFFIWFISIIRSFWVGILFFKAYD